MGIAVEVDDAEHVRAASPAPITLTEADVAAARPLFLFVDGAIAIEGDGGTALETLPDGEIAAAAIAWARQRRTTSAAWLEQQRLDAELEALIASGKVVRLKRRRSKSARPSPW